MRFLATTVPIIVNSQFMNILRFHFEELQELNLGD